MIDDPNVREAVIFVAALGLAVLLAAVTANRAQTESPVWPIRLWFFVLRMQALPWFRRYPDKRRAFSPREQFLANFFVWFFLLFIAAILLFGCNHRTGCQ